jgi:bifunctional DNA-binding transcriptional regulator/antitoxin component of YhaV-PrlF toxin-antitoxin module
MGLSDSNITEKQITRDSDQNHILELDSRGRVTIPSSLRSRYGVDPKDNREYWFDLVIDNIEVRGSEDVSQMQFTHDHERDQMLKIDSRGRVTIPSSLRKRHRIEFEDDKEYWLQFSINSIEIRDTADGDDEQS